MHTKLVYSWRMAKCGKRTMLFKPMQINNIKGLSLEDRVFIGEGAWLFGSPDVKGALKIGSGTTIGHFSHIVAYHDVRIGNEVLIADKVFISDCTHEYADVSSPITNQPIANIKPVKIGDGSWIGESVSIIGSEIGVHCVIGANAVVIHDIPDYSVAVGVPAKVVSRYDNQRNEWTKC